MCAEVDYGGRRFTSCGHLAYLLGVKVPDLVPTHREIAPVAGMCLCAVDVAESARRHGMFSVKQAEIYRLMPAA